MQNVFECCSVGARFNILCGITPRNSDKEESRPSGLLISMILVTTLSDAILGIRFQETTSNKYLDSQECHQLATVRCWHLSCTAHAAMQSNFWY